MAEFNDEITEALRKFFSFLKPLRGNLRLQLHATLSPRESLIAGIQNNDRAMLGSDWFLRCDAIF